MVHLLWWSEVKIGIGDRPRWTVAHCPKRLQPQFQPDWNHSVRPKIEILLWSSLCESSKRRQKDLLGQLVHLISTLYKPQKKSAKQPTTLTFKVLSEPLFRPQKLFSWKNGLFFFTFCPLLFGCQKVGASEARFAPIDLQVCLFVMGDLPPENERKFP